MDNINRIKIGIVFNFNKGWLGGVYYILNIIKSLNYLDDKDKPELIVFYSADLADFIDEIYYPYLKLVPFKFRSTYKSYILSWIMHKNLFVKDLTDQFPIDVIFPIWDYPLPISHYPKVISWYADFQHKFYPEFFSKLTLIRRELRIRLTLRNATDLVLSSHDAVSHLIKFYRVKDKLNIHILQFASNIDDIALIDFEQLKKKYQLPDKYFMISNQFHKHKNHIVLLEAFSLLKKKGKQYHFVITGKMENRGNEKYIESIRSLIEKDKLNDAVSLLGLVPRQEQLSMMKYAQAVIQPSLFEGWSTVIEDAKSLQVPVIASNLPIHREQLGDKGRYFNPKDAKELAQIISLFQHCGGNIYEDYNLRVRQFAKNFIEIISEN